MKRQSPRGFTLVEMLTVMAVIAILASLILSVNGFVQRKAATSRAEGEIAAMSAQCESYKADNGSYPRSNKTDELDSKDPTKAGNPNSSAFKEANLELYRALSGDAEPKNAPDGKPETKPYFEFKRDQLSGKKGTNGQFTEVYFIMDPFGNPYGYSTAGMAGEEAYQAELSRKPETPRPSTSMGHNTGIDIWSTGGSTSTARDPNTNGPKDVKKWIKNW
ncbi:MAG TPA: type II secretion system protein [Chthoniobacteraceae bacterium]